MWLFWQEICILKLILAISFYGIRYIGISDFYIKLDQRLFVLWAQSEGISDTILYLAVSEALGQ